jgi:outer membrane protein assembly factor BamB
VQPTRRQFLIGSLAAAGAASLFHPQRGWAADAVPLAAEFVSPWGLDFDEDGNLFVADAGAYRVSVFDGNGGLVRTFGVAGRGEGKLNYPSGLAVHGESVFVCDTNNGRIVEFGRDGSFVRHVGGLGIATAKLAMPNGVAVGDKWLWVANTRGHVLQRYAPEAAAVDRAFGVLGDDAGALPAGTVDYKLRQPTAVAASEGRVFVLDSKHSRVLAVDEQGALIWEAAPSFGGLGLNRAEGLAVHLGMLYVADTGNDRLLKLNAQGVAIDARSVAPEPVAVAGHAGTLAVSSRKTATVAKLGLF